MFDQLFQGIISAIMVADTQTALSLLQDGQSLFLDPIQGSFFHAKTLYYAIKKANVEVIKQLLNLNVHSDVCFYNYCGTTPLGLVLSEGIREAVPEVISKTDKNFALALAVKLHDNQTLDFLLSRCAFKSRFLQYLGLQK